VAAKSGESMARIVRLGRFEAKTAEKVEQGVGVLVVTAGVL
jgi:hypothetical protein